MKKWPLVCQESMPETWPDISVTWDGNLLTWVSWVIQTPSGQLDQWRQQQQVHAREDTVVVVTSSFYSESHDTYHFTLSLIVPCRVNLNLNLNLSLSLSLVWQRHRFFVHPQLTGRRWQISCPHQCSPWDVVVTKPGRAGCHVRYGLRRSLPKGYLYSLIQHGDGRCMLTKWSRSLVVRRYIEGLSDPVTWTHYNEVGCWAASKMTRPDLLHETSSPCIQRAI